MGSSSAVVHDLLLSRLGRFYPSTVNIQVRTAVTSASGEQTFTWANLAGHVSLVCWVASSGGQESKRADGTVAFTSHKIAIAGHYPTIVPTMRAASGGVTYDIEAVAHDSQGRTTSLQCQVVT
jgi:head-tail adaptor